MSDQQKEQLIPVHTEFGDGQRGRSNSRSMTPTKLHNRGSVKEQLQRDIGSNGQPLTLSQHKSADRNNDDLNLIDRGQLRKNSRSFLEEEAKAAIDKFNMSSNGSQNSKDGKQKKDEQKFYKEQAERLERKLIEKEFFKHYDWKAIYFVFMLVFTSNVLINVDHGTLPGCAIPFSACLKIDQAQFGSIGSIVYIGISLGAAIAVIVFQKAKFIKAALVLTLGCNTGLIFLFGRSTNFVYDTTIRFFVGFCQVFVCIFMPVWTDAFANEKQKTLWLTFLILASPLGIVFGFIMTSVFTAHTATDSEGCNEGWRWSFYVQCFLMTPMAIGFLLTPLKYLDIDRTSKYREKCQQKVQQQLYKYLNKQKMGDSYLGGPRKSENDVRSERLSQNDVRSVKSFSTVGGGRGGASQIADFKMFLEDVNDDLFDHQLDIPKTDNNIRKLREKTLRKIEKEIKKKNNLSGEQKDEAARRGSVFASSSKLSFYTKMKQVVTNKVFLSLMFALTGLFYVVTGIQYWLPDYIQNVLDIEPHTATLYFVVVSLSAPIGGVIVGGIVTNAYGGYNNRSAQKIQMIMGCGAVICALPVPFFSEKSQFYYVGLLFWGILFFGGFILPPVTGIMLNSVPDSQKASANSVATLTYNVFGYFPAPVIYGFVATFTEVKGTRGQNISRWAMGALLYSTIPTIGALLWGISRKLKQGDSEDERNGTIVGKKKPNQEDDEKKRLIDNQNSDQEITDSAKPSMKSGKMNGILNPSERDSFQGQFASRPQSKMLDGPDYQAQSTAEDINKTGEIPSSPMGGWQANGTESNPSYSQSNV